MVDQLAPQEAVQGSEVDLTPLFEELAARIVGLEHTLAVHGGEVLRVLVFYARPRPPVLSSVGALNTLLALPGFFVDFVAFSPDADADVARIISSFPFLSFPFFVLLSFAFSHFRSR